VGKTKHFTVEYRGRKGIFIVLETISNSSSIEPLMIRFISSGSKLEPLLTLLAFISCGSSCEPSLMRSLSATVVVMNRCW
jgi:hypothetical protein